MSVVVYVDIQDVTVEVEIVEDELLFGIVEDHIDVELNVYEDQIDVEIVEQEITVALQEETIEVFIDDCCLAVGGGSGVDPHILPFSYDDDTIEVGDLVYIDSVLPTKVNKAIDNKSPNPIIGIVHTKSPSILQVLMWGSVQAGDNISPGRKLYVSPIGTITDVLPEDDYVQVIGTILDTSEILIRPEQIRVKRLEFILL